VPPTEEYLCRGLIQSGAAALALYTQERERLHAEQASNAPEEPNTTVTDVKIREKPLTFVVVEDDIFEIQRLRDALEGKPVIFAEDFTSAMNAIHAEAAKGNEVGLVTDMQVPFGDQGQYVELSQKEWVKDTGDDMKWGIALANAAKAGKIPGVDTRHVALMTAGDPQYYQLADGVTVLDKRSYLLNACSAFIEKAMASTAGLEQHL
jgi:hypothetical protein